MNGRKTEGGKAERERESDPGAGCDSSPSGAARGEE